MFPNITILLYYFEYTVEIQIITPDVFSFQ